MGGEYECFAMPYYDWTEEIGFEDHPQILKDILGSDGIPTNYNKIEWPVNTTNYWVPGNCLPQSIDDNDKYPFCALKRAFNHSYQFPIPTVIGDIIQNNENYADFSIQFSKYTCLTKPTKKRKNKEKNVLRKFAFQKRRKKNNQKNCLFFLSPNNKIKKQTLYE